MNTIKNITYGLIGGTFGVTGLGVIDGGQIFAISSVTLGGLAMISCLIFRNQLQRKKLDTKVAMEMR
jgi:hypothetical protein